MPRVNCEPGDEETFDLVAEPDNKAFKVNFAEFVQYLHNTKYRSGVSSLITLDDTLMTAQYSLVYTYNCPYAEMLDRKTTQFLEGGFSTHWYKEIFNPTDMKRELEDIGPQVLTMDHLEIGFIVWLVPVLLCILVFIIEIAIRPCRKFINRARNELAAKYGN